MKFLNKIKAFSLLVIIVLLRKHKDFIIDSINNYFNRYGLQNNYEPNSLGVQLENLLDLFLKNLSEN